MRHVRPIEPGPLQHWWWRASQRTRLVTIGCLTALGMVATGAAVTLPGAPPPGAPTADDRPFPSVSTSATPPVAGDVAITVTEVPAVDLVHGEDPDRGPVVIKVPGIVSTLTCWTTEAQAEAEKLLRGKQIWLPAGHRPTDQSGRAIVPVRLSDGADYAEVAASRGLAQTDATAPAPNQSDLAAAEALAKQSLLGAWRPCATDAPQTTPTGESGGGPEPTTDQRPGDTERPAPQTTHEPPPDDGVQRGVELGAPCSPEGARGVTSTGQDVVCTAPGGSSPKWMKP